MRAHVSPQCCRVARMYKRDSTHATSVCMWSPPSHGSPAFVWSHLPDLKLFEELQGPRPKHVENNCLKARSESFDTWTSLLVPRSHSEPEIRVFTAKP